MNLRISSTILARCGRASIRPPRIATAKLTPRATPLARRAYASWGPQPKYSRFGSNSRQGESSSSSSGSEGGALEIFGYRLVWDRNTKIIAGVTAFGTGYYVWHLERVEQTGRWRFIDVSEQTEREVGEQSFKEVLQEFSGKLLPANDPTSLFVRRVAERILTGTGLGEISHNTTGSDLALAQSATELGGWDPDADRSRLAKQEWEVFVIKDDKIPNAFVLPGGKIFVFTGILPICKDEDGLAAVLGHEIAHQVARHSGEKMSGAKVVLGLAFILELLGWDIGLSRIGLTLLLALPNSRKIETEADQIGLRLMSQACFDPHEAAHVWKRMAQAEKHNTGWFGMGIGGSDVDFMSTHPASTKRIKKMEEWLPHALSIRAASPQCAGIPETMDGFVERSGLRRAFFGDS